MSWLLYKILSWWGNWMSLGMNVGIILVCWFWCEYCEDKNLI